MKIISVKTSELQGKALDWSVARAVGQEIELCGDHPHAKMGRRIEGRYQPSTNWAQGGPLIEKYRVNFYHDYSDEETPTANVTGYGHCASGDTLLIACMRVIVALKIGDTVEIPEELLK